MSQRLLKDASYSAKSIIAYTIRSVLREAASTALRKQIQQKIDSSALKIKKRRCHGQASTVTTALGDKDNTKSIQVDQEDIDVAYDTALRIGKRWRDKLNAVGEDEVANAVEKVLGNNRFLEPDFIDDFSFDTDADIIKGGTFEGCTLTDHGVQSLNIQNDKNDNGDIIVDSVDGESIIDISDNTIENKRMQNENKDIKTDPSEPFFATLSKLGYHDPCNLEHEHTKSHLPKATEWAPLPGTIDPFPGKQLKTSNDNENTNHNSPNFVHIPKSTILPTSQIQALPPNQLYGYPAPTLLKPNILSKMHTSNINSNFSSFAASSIEAVEKKQEFLQGQIQTLNRLSPLCYWNYGWDLIQLATERNRNRLHLETKEKAATHEIKILPKKGIVLFEHNHYQQQQQSLAQPQQQEADNEKNGDDDDNNFSVHERGINVNEVSYTNHKKHKNNIEVISHDDKSGKNDPIAVSQFFSDRTNRIMEQRLRRKKREVRMNKYSKNSLLSTKNTMNGTGKIDGHYERGRKASNHHASMELPFEEILDSLSESEKKVLEKTMIHPESEEEQKLESGYHQVRGALKTLGSIHLWEQVRGMNWDGPQDVLPASSTCSGSEEEDEGMLKRRKKAFQKAKRQRLGNSLEMNAKQELSSPFSKIKWAYAPSSKQVGGPVEQEQVSRNNNIEQWMEMDLGECMITVITPSTGTNFSIEHSKKMLAFRSLEISLKMEA